MSFPEYPQGGKPSNVVVSAQVHLFGAINLHTVHAIAVVAVAEATVVQAGAQYVMHLNTGGIQETSAAGCRTANLVPTVVA